jgi:hypothetical protein
VVGGSWRAAGGRGGPVAPAAQAARGGPQPALPAAARCCPLLPAAACRARARTLTMTRPYWKGLMPSLPSRVAWEADTRSPTLTRCTDWVISMVPLLILVAMPRAWRQEGGGGRVRRLPKGPRLGRAPGGGRESSHRQLSSASAGRASSALWRGAHLEEGGLGGVHARAAGGDVHVVGRQQADAGGGADLRGGAGRGGARCQRQSRGSEGRRRPRGSLQVTAA